MGANARTWLSLREEEMINFYKSLDEKHLLDMVEVIKHTPLKSQPKKLKTKMSKVMQIRYNRQKKAYKERPRSIRIQETDCN